MSVKLDNQHGQFLDQVAAEDSHLELTLFLSSFDLCILFASPPELILLLFSIVADVLTINDKHTLPVKTCQQSNIF
jgi:hypothetical protein